MSPDMQRCIENCTACHATCVQTIQHCLGMGGKHADAAHIGLMTDCAQICSVSADFMLRASDLHGRVCGVCADVCRRCADDCERVGGGDDGQMQRCVEACRRCVDSCSAMASAA